MVARMTILMIVNLLTVTVVSIITVLVIRISLIATTSGTTIKNSNRDRQTRGVLKLYGEPESPKEGAPSNFGHRAQRKSDTNSGVGRGQPGEPPEHNSRTQLGYRGGRCRCVRRGWTSAGPLAARCSPGFGQHRSPSTEVHLCDAGHEPRPSRWPEPPRCGHIRDGGRGSTGVWSDPVWTDDIPALIHGAS